jgi:hypothetical protein
VEEYVQRGMHNYQEDPSFTTNQDDELLECAVISEQDMCRAVTDWSEE